LQLKTKKVKLNKLIYPIVVLSLIVLLSLAATYSWLSNTKKATMNSADKYITIDADAGLEMNYGDEDMNESTININNVVKEGFALYECSSVDGKNIFFPLSGYNSVKQDVSDGEFVSNANTKDFLFRPATVNDKNSKYISVDLSLLAKTDTPIWLSNDSYIEDTTDQDNDPDTNIGIADAIRIAFIENEPNGKTVIFDNSTQGYGEEYTGINKIARSETDNDDGSDVKIGAVTSTLKYECNSIESYTFDANNGENALFELKAGVEKKITVNIWLEGTDLQCTDSIAGLEDLDIFIKFSTTSEDLKPYYFIDHTLEQWVDDDDCYVFAIDATGKMQPMRKSDNYETDHTWIVELAGSKKPVQFARYNPELQENSPQEWNIWESGDPGSCTTYNAFAHNTGIWDNNFTGDTITFFDAMTDHPILEQSSDTEMLVCFTAQDGNGNDIDYTYKMSNQWNEKRWRVVIPSDVNDLTFKWCASEDTTGAEPWLYYETTDRGNNTYFSANDYGGGYWSNKVLLVDSSNGGWADVGDGTIWVAYFFDGNTEIGWTAMNGKTTGGRYMAGVPEGATQVIFCRYTEYAGYFGWDAVYNQTNDLTFGTNNLYKVSGFDGSNKVTGTWQTTSNID